MDRSRTERLKVIVSSEEIAAIDEFRSRARMPSRAAAVRELLKRGLAAEGFATAKSRSRSKHYGVVEAAKAGANKGAGRTTPGAA